MPFHSSLAGIVAMLIAGAATAAAPPAGAESDILAARAQWLKSYGGADETPLESLLTDDATLIESRGDLHDKASIVARARQPEIPLTLSAGEARVRRIGDVAIVTGKVLERRGPNRLEFQVSDTFRRDGARWRLTASHWTRTGGEYEEVRLAPAALDRFTGTFVTPRRTLLTVTREGSRLLVTDPSGARTPFVAVSDTMIQSPSNKVRWLFIDGPDGRVRNAVVANQNVLTLLTRQDAEAAR